MLERLAGLCLAASLSSAALAAAAPPQELRDTVKALDARLFAAYNSCDIDTLSSMVSDDLEFYHDQSGLMTGKAAFIEAIRSNICGKVRRTLDEDTLEVHTLKGYGAVEIGIHRFCPVDEAGACRTTAGPARFVHLWRQDGTDWQLARVISFDHH